MKEKTIAKSSDTRAIILRMIIFVILLAVISILLDSCKPAEKHISRDIEIQKIDLSPIHILI